MPTPGRTCITHRLAPTNTGLCPLAARCRSPSPELKRVRLNTHSIVLAVHITLLEKGAKLSFSRREKNIRTPSPATIWAAPGRCEKPSPRVRACLLFDTQDTPSYRVCGLGSLFKIKLTPRLPSLPLLCGVELCRLLWPGSTSRPPAISRSATASGLYE